MHPSEEDEQETRVKKTTKSPLSTGLPARDDKLALKRMTSTRKKGLTIAKQSGFFELDVRKRKSFKRSSVGKSDGSYY